VSDNPVTVVIAGETRHGRPTADRGAGPACDDRLAPTTAITDITKCVP
jgi:hypothetical protein